ncbi:MAG: hypothetical protein WBV79_11365 [Rhodomicrobium sp.]
MAGENRSCSWFDKLTMRISPLRTPPEADSLFSAWRLPYVARGVFGAPTFFVNGELHFGQDRLHFVSFVPGVMENGARRAPFGKWFVRRAGL